MRPNKLREIWAKGGATVNGWCGIPSSFSAETMAHAGWDSVTVDLQHGLNDYQVAVTMFQAISTTDTVPLCRVPWNEPGIVGKMLDAGAYGVICPMVNTPEDAAKFAAYTHYPPLGQRSFGPVRGLLYGGPDYAVHANDTIVAIAQIETPEAVENVDAICATPGIDAVYIGPADLALGYGKKPAFDTEDPEMLDKYKIVIEAVKKHGKVGTMHCGSVDYALRMVEMGFQMTTILSDARIMAASSAAMVKAFKDGGSSGTATPTGSGY